MEIELVDFYPVRDKTGKIMLGKNDIKGSLHIYLSEIDLDIRGIWVVKKKEKWLFKMPWKKSYDEQGKDVIYPCIDFNNKNKKNEIFTFLHREAKKFITDKLKNEYKIKIKGPFKAKKEKNPQDKQTANSQGFKKGHN